MVLHHFHFSPHRHAASHAKSTNNSWHGRVIVLFRFFQPSRLHAVLNRSRQLQCQHVNHTLLINVQMSPSINAKEKGVDTLKIIVVYFEFSRASLILTANCPRSLTSLSGNNAIRDILMSTSDGATVNSPAKLPFLNGNPATRLTPANLSRLATPGSSKSSGIQIAM